MCQAPCWVPSEEAGEDTETCLGGIQLSGISAVKDFDGKQSWAWCLQPGLAMAETWRWPLRFPTQPVCLSLLISRAQGRLEGLGFAAEHGQGLLPPLGF